MAFTRYWSRTNNYSAATGERLYQQALAECREVIRVWQEQYRNGPDGKQPERLSGYSAHTDAYGGLHINGTGDLAHEDFCLREHYRENTSGFCKTARKPYDTVVGACLKILASYRLFRVDSDGPNNEQEIVDLIMDATTPEQEVRT